MQADPCQPVPWPHEGQAATPATAATHPCGVPSAKSLVRLVWLCAIAFVHVASADPLETVTQPYHGAGRPLPIAPFASAASAPRVDERWEVLTQDITLARTLERWASVAGYRLKWDAQRNFLIGAPDSVQGTFEKALQAILDSAGIRQSDYPLEACIYANTPPLVRVTRQGEQARECAAQ